MRWKPPDADAMIGRWCRASRHHRRAGSSSQSYGDSARFRFRESIVWILSTDPFIVALPAGAPKYSWRDFATIATGFGDAQLASPVDPLLARYVVDEELDQPRARLLVFPPGFWNDATQSQPAEDGGAQLSVVTLRQPMSIDDALDPLAAGDALRLGRSETAAPSRSDALRSRERHRPPAPPVALTRGAPAS
jgi:hypothetical protein